MLRKYAVRYYREGYNCSQCLLKAGKILYNIPVTDDMLKMCSAVNMGFGIGGICSLIIGGIMLFGLMCDENTAKSMRLRLLSEFKAKYGSIECGRLQKNEEKCEEIIGFTADLIEKYLNEK